MKSLSLSVFVPLLLTASLAHAQAFKCVVNGKIEYSGTPCHGATSIARVGVHSTVVDERNRPLERNPIEATSVSVNETATLASVTPAPASSVERNGGTAKK